MSVKILSKDDIIKEALKFDFDEIGFTTAEPFESQKEILLSPQEEYNWLIKSGVNLMEVIDPKKLYPNAKSISVVVASYFNEDFPSWLVGKFGRCYLDDNWMTQDGLTSFMHKKVWM